MKYRELVKKQLETLINRVQGVKNAVDGNKLSKQELLSQFDQFEKELQRIYDEVENEDLPPINFQ